ncbi:MAG: Holliday junction resolvase RuvX [Candidatus Omnitrophota bacterium]|jgi:putative Holliday junction resolvase
MRIMGLDFGTKRIGVAISDGLMITAQGQDSIYRTELSKDLDVIKKLIKDNGITEVVVGLPISMNGTYSAKTKEVIEFVDTLSKAIEIPIKTWDERLTSLQAERVMLEADMSRHKRKMLSDRLAAQIILQTYMDFRKKG